MGSLVKDLMKAVRDNSGVAAAATNTTDTTVKAQSIDMEIL
jgi:hypothetical protein